MEDELARDMELAQQIACAPSPDRITDERANASKSEVFACEGPEASTSKSNSNISDYRERCNGETSCPLVSLQIRSTFYKVEGGLMPLLKKCLESESGNSRSIISGHVDHFQSISEDFGWGCGWRNIQMLSSHLLMQRQEAREVMFGRSGFVPDIPSLQRWLEIAWERGFDRPGSESFNQKVYCSRKWIGSTECAALFRSFGLRARVVDFSSKDFELLSSSVHDENVEVEAGRRKKEHVYGPMDEFLCTKRCVSKVDPFECEKPRCARNNYTLKDHSKSRNFSKREIDGHQLLVHWVWNYFTVESIKCADNFHHVFVSDKTPLYFQHDGHSRTIVGIQSRQSPDGMSEQHSLLVLDPSHRTAALERSLKENFGWQKLIKRGVHTLKKPQYQVVVVLKLLEFDASYPLKFLLSPFPILVMLH